LEAGARRWSAENRLPGRQGLPLACFAQLALNFLEITFLAGYNLIYIHYFYNL
jgi:hypothetical protein